MLMINYKEALPEEFHFQGDAKVEWKKKMLKKKKKYKKISHCVLLDPRPESTESVYEDDEDVGGGEDLKDEK